MSSTGVSPISLTAQPDYATQLAALQRQQQLAQQLQQQASAPIDVSSYNGVQAPISPLAVLAKALQGYEAGNLSNKSAKAQSDLNKTDVQQAMAGMNAANIPFSAGSPGAAGVSAKYQLPPMPIGGTQVGQVNGQTGLVPSATPAGSTSPLQYTLDTPDLPAMPSSYQQQMAAAAPLLGGGPVSKEVGQQIFSKAASDQETQQTLQRQMAAMAPIIATMPPDQQTIVSNMAAIDPSKALSYVTTFQQEKAKAPQILTPQQAASYGLPALTKPGSYYQGNPLDGFKPVDTSDVASPGAEAQKLREQIAGRAVIVNSQNQLPTGTNGMVPGVTGDAIPHPEKSGYASMPVNGAGGLTQAAIDQSAMTYALTNQMPSMGMGSTGVAGQRRQAIMNRAAEMNPSGNMAANKARVIALDGALKKNVDQGNQIATNLDNATNEGTQLIGAFNGKINNSVPLVNVLANAAAYNLDPKTVASYRAGLTDLATTYSTVFARNGQITDQTRNMARDIADGNISLPALQSVLNQVNTQGKIIVQGYADKRAGLQKQFSTILTGQPVASAAQPKTIKFGDLP